MFQLEPKHNDTGRSNSKMFDKRYDFYFLIVNSSFCIGNIPTSLTCGVYVSELFCKCRLCDL